MSSNHENRSDWPSCRICHSSSNRNELVSPCNCKGTRAFVHQECLNQWFRTTEISRCPTCHYRMQWSWNRENRPYAIKLESMFYLPIPVITVYCILNVFFGITIFDLLPPTIYAFINVVVYVAVFCFLLMAQFLIVFSGTLIILYFGFLLIKLWDRCFNKNLAERFVLIQEHEPKRIWKNKGN
uniref:RING-CH-type domain-containing protein n=1 Tax=Acrobeloides nanus TaxID=290746 RepID=A0A914CUA7_9BILA